MRPVGYPKTGGRQKGTPNNRTLALSDTLESLGFDPLPKLVELLPNLTPEKQADVLLKLMEFIYPKRKAIDLTVDNTDVDAADIEYLREVSKLSIEQIDERMVRLLERQS